MATPHRPVHTSTGPPSATSTADQDVPPAMKRRKPLTVSQLRRRLYPYGLFRLRSTSEIPSLTCRQLTEVVQQAMENSVPDGPFWRLLCLRARFLVGLLSPKEMTAFLSALVAIDRAESEFLRSAVPHLCEQLPSYSLGQMADVLYAYGKLGGPSNELVEATGRILPSKIKFMREKTLVKLLDAYKLLGVVDDNVFPLLYDFMCVKRRHFTPQQLVCVVESMAALNARHRPTLAALTEVLAAYENLERLTLDELSVLLHSYASLQIYSNSLFRGAMKALCVASTFPPTLPQPPTPAPSLPSPSIFALPSPSAPAADDSTLTVVDMTADERARERRVGVGLEVIEDVADALPKGNKKPEVGTDVGGSVGMSTTVGREAAVMAYVGDGKTDALLGVSPSTAVPVQSVTRFLETWAKVNYWRAPLLRPLLPLCMSRLAQLPPATLALLIGGAVRCGIHSHALWRRLLDALPTHMQHMRPQSLLLILSSIRRHAQVAAVYTQAIDRAPSSGSKAMVTRQQRGGEGSNALVGVGVDGGASIGVAAARDVGLMVEYLVEGVNIVLEWVHKRIDAMTEQELIKTATEMHALLSAMRDVGRHVGGDGAGNDSEERWARERNRSVVSHLAFRMALKRADNTALRDRLPRESLDRGVLRDDHAKALLSGRFDPSRPFPSLTAFAMLIQLPQRQKPHRSKSRSSSADGSTGDVCSYVEVVGLPEDYAAGPLVRMCREHEVDVFKTYVRWLEALLQRDVSKTKRGDSPDNGLVGREQSRAASDAREAGGADRLRGRTHDSESGTGGGVDGGVGKRERRRRRERHKWDADDRTLGNMKVARKVF
ncbi:unnamed protein product [Vitrella brassicaformis CCMP3155]|uniref:Uncharacterized protein n=1 Tax=Vitrella brassicaformis (strain CCMP3155) TaxID=1169540 RepID=A0A0G4FMQ3_VITBC|nr:unnamed protein product [Vitrella brassicaformis CCMP3155]|eukprot:CEM15523.1 unnamed protein product [Vitrella brassicaformis CCMP3155]